MQEQWRFLWNFLQDPAAISSVIPTSRFGIREVANKIQGDVRRVIVEYGPGTGGVAKALLKNGKLTDDSLLILIEQSADLVKLLRKIDDSRIRVFHDSAENVRGILKQCDEKGADYVLCSAPLTMMPPNVRKKILSETRAILKPGASMITYLVRRKVAQWQRDAIGPTISERVWLNIPPLVVSESIKPINGHPTPEAESNSTEHLVTS
jgi:phospholipid N-methyltransferase